MIVNHPTFVDAPIIAARLGLKLFPVRLIPCSNGSLNKVPAIRGGHGYLDATDDVAVLTAWASAHPDAAIGVPCRPNGFIALDNDEPARTHIHTIVRTPNGNDYGRDLLRQHYERAPHHHPRHTRD